MNDTGKFVGNYLRILGYISLVMMLASMLHSYVVTVNLTFILLIWAGGELTRHNLLARTWVIRFSFLSIIIIIATCVYIGMAGKEKIEMDIFGIIFELPTLLFYTTMGGLLVLSAIPPFYLIRGGTDSFDAVQTADTQESADDNIP